MMSLLQAIEADVSEQGGEVVSEMDSDSRTHPPAPDLRLDRQDPEGVGGIARKTVRV